MHVSVYKFTEADLYKIKHDFNKIFLTFDSQLKYNLYNIQLLGGASG